MKFSQSILVALAALSIGEVAAQRNFGAGKGKGNSGGNGGGGNAAAVSASTTNAAAASASTVNAAASSSATANTGSTDAGTGTNGNSASFTLDQSAIQTASESTGSANAEAGQTDSATDPANFINFCANKAKGNLTNGLQQQDGSCNGIVMGQIPPAANMISSVITFPTGDNDNIAANQAFTINVKATNLAAGTFTNPDTTYYAAPQTLDGNGNVIGHTHVTVQDCGGSLPTSPLDPNTFAFFKGINTPVDANGLLTANVTEGLPAGFYRVCTMGAAANHQPLLMPIAQRGAQDDCKYFSVGGVAANQGSGASGSASGSTGSGSGSAAASSSSAAGAAATALTGNTGSTGTSSATTGSTTATGGNKGGSGSGRNGKGGRGGRSRGRFMARAYVA